MKTPLFLALILWSSPAAAAPLDFFNGRLFIRADVNGVATDALLDSAAEATIVDPAFAKKAKLPEGIAQEIRGSAGKASARIIEGAKITALGLELHPDAIVASDLSNLSKFLIKRPTQMVLGRELFDARRLRIDIPGHQITVVSRSARPRGVKLPLTTHAGVEAIAAEIGGTSASAEFDLGNGTDVLISRALVNRLRLKVMGEKSGGGIGGAIVRDTVDIPALTVAGKRFYHVLGAIDDQSNANDLNLGTSILKHFLITADFKDRVVWLAPK